MKTTRPLTHVEVDHAQLDLFVIDPETGEPIGCPQLSMAIDEVTRAVVGMDRAHLPEHRRQ